MHGTKNYICIIWLYSNKAGCTRAPLFGFKSMCSFVWNIELKYENQLKSTEITLHPWLYYMYSFLVITTSLFRNYEIFSRNHEMIFS